MQVLILDCLAVGENLKRDFTRDFIGGGPKLIAGIIKQLEIPDSHIKLYRAEDFLKENKSTLQKFDICLLSAMSMDLKTVDFIIKFWQDINPNIFLIIGGPISLDPDLLMKINANISVVGEGERKIVSIFKTLIETSSNITSENLERFKKIKGINFRFDDEIIINDPDTFLSSETYQYFTDSEYYSGFLRDYSNYKTARIYVECLRGCSNFIRTKFRLKSSKECIPSCTICTNGDMNTRLKCPAKIPPGCGFCSTIHSFGPPKSRKVENILKEIRNLVDMGVRRIVLGGPDFLDYQRENLVKAQILTNPGIPPAPNYMLLDKLISGIISISAIKEERVQIFIENIKASLCTDEALKIIAKIPNAIFSIGCETGSDEFSLLLGRPFTPSTSLEAIKKAVNLGIRVHVYFIHSLPGETVKYLKDSINLINQLYTLGDKVEKITIYRFQNFPGAPFYGLLERDKLLQQNNKQLNKFRKKLVNIALNFNRERKIQMIGNTFDTLIAEKTFTNDNNAIGYILKGGPKVLIENGESRLGDQVVVQVQRVLSDKLIIGKIISDDN